MRKFLIVMGLIMILLTGCSLLKISEEYYVLYSRDDVAAMCASEGFGKGRSDDIYTALKYAYESAELSEKYGDSFEITGEDIICYTSEGSSFFFAGIFKGEARYGFVFDNEIYTVSLSKDYWGKWKVDSCELAPYYE